ALRMSELPHHHPETKNAPTHRGIAGARFKTPEAPPHQSEPAPRLPDQIGAAGDRALIAVDADHACTRGVQDRARVTAGAEGRIDVDAAVMHREPRDDAADEHGNMRRRCVARDHGDAPNALAANRTPNSTLNSSPCTRPGHRDVAEGKLGAH